MLISTDKSKRMAQVARLMRSHDLTRVRFREGREVTEVAMPSRGVFRAALLSVESSSRGQVLLHHACQGGPRVEPGTAVVAGQVLTMIANGPLFDVVCAPRDGRIVEILVRHGASVETGDVLLTMA